MDFGLAGKRAVVLGATGGLGAAIARALAVEGAVVTICGRDEERLVAVAKGLRDELDARVWTSAFDLTSRAAITRFLDSELHGEVDILVNNAGGPAPGPILEVTEDQWIDDYTKLFVSLSQLTRRLVPRMRARGWGRVITVVSSGVIAPLDNLGISNSVRLSVVGWSKTLANEVARDGVTVNCVAPGRIATARVAALDRDRARRTGQPLEAVVAASQQSIPVQRYGTPQEFADVVAFLASTRSSFVNGSVLRVDGGMIRAI